MEVLEHHGEGGSLDPVTGLNRTTEVLKLDKICERPPLVVDFNRTMGVLEHQIDLLGSKLYPV